MKANLGTIGKEYKNERISVSFGKTINNGNYESTRIDFSFARDLDIGEDKKKALLEEFLTLQIMVEETIKEMAKKTKKGKI